MRFHRIRTPQPDARRALHLCDHPHFLSAFGMETLRDLPNIEALEDAGLLSRHAVQEDVAASRESVADEDEELSSIE